MSSTVRRLWLCLLLAGCVTLPTAGQQRKVPTSMKKLANGLTVVVSEDHSAHAFGPCISYGIGFRLEPEGRTGFAHLFDHMMFEGTPNAPKGVLESRHRGRRRRHQQ
jgi:zinc protease